MLYFYKFSQKKKKKLEFRMTRNKETNMPRTQHKIMAKNLVG